MLEECEKQKRELCVLLMFVFEGDNTLDALEMATVAAKATELSTADGDVPTWKTPASWQRNYGSLPDFMLY